MRRIAITGILFAAAAQSQAPQFQDIAALDQQVAVVAKAQPIDPRLKLAHCPQPIILEPEQMGALIVRCMPLGWRIRVPVLKATTTATLSEMLVRRGETVEMVSSGEGYEVSTNAVALENGSLGAAIRVKSPTGGLVSVVTVTARGLVSIAH